MYAFLAVASKCLDAAAHVEWLYRWGERWLPTTARLVRERQEQAAAADRETLARFLAGELPASVLSEGARADRSSGDVEMDSDERADEKAVETAVGLVAPVVRRKQPITPLDVPIEIEDNSPPSPVDPPRRPVRRPPAPDQPTTSAAKPEASSSKTPAKDKGAAIPIPDGAEKVSGKYVRTRCLSNRLSSRWIPAALRVKPPASTAGWC